ncbi:hypothetical protein D3C76_1637760 [compost metagenome]
MSCAEHDFRNPHIEQAQAGECITLAQHRRPSERVQKTPMDMAGLAFYVKQLSVTAHEALHATLTTAPDIGFFHPFTALIPVVIEWVLGSDFRSCCTLLCHLLPLA